MTNRTTGQRLVNLDRCEVVTFLLVEIQTEDACKKASGPRAGATLRGLLGDLLLFLRDRRRRDIIQAESGKSGQASG